MKTQERENEGKVIQELGSPGKVAAIIRADLENEGYSTENIQRRDIPMRDFRKKMYRNLRK